MILLASMTYQLLLFQEPTGEVKVRNLKKLVIKPNLAIYRNMIAQVHRIVANFLKLKELILES